MQQKQLTVLCQAVVSCTLWISVCRCCIPSLRRRPARRPKLTKL